LASGRLQSDPHLFLVTTGVRRSTIHTSIEDGLAPELDYDVTRCMIHSEGKCAFTAARCIDNPKSRSLRSFSLKEEKARYAYLNTD
jgi:hypothetical protein